MTRAAAGCKHHNNIARLKRLRGDVAGVADAVADFKLTLWLEGEGARTPAAEFEAHLARKIAEIDVPPTKFQTDVVVFCGLVAFGNVKGYESSRAKSFVKTLAQTFRVITLSEYKTSKQCWTCGCTLVKTRGWSVRQWRCPNREHTAGQSCMQVNAQGKRRHVHEENKDTVAALSMLRIGLALLLTGQKPRPWCTPKQIKEHDEAVAKATKAKAKDEQAQKRQRQDNTPDVQQPVDQQQPVVEQQPAAAGDANSDVAMAIDNPAAGSGAPVDGGVGET